MPIMPSSSFGMNEGWDLIMEVAEARFNKVRHQLDTFVRTDMVSRHILFWCDDAMRKTVAWMFCQVIKSGHNAEEEKKAL